MADSRHSSKIFYGWYIVAACFLIMTMLWGALQNVLPIYLKPVIEDMGWDRGAFTFAMVIAGVTMCVISPVAGSLIDRLGARPVMIVGTLLIAFGLLAGSRITQLWQFYIMFAIVGCGFVCTTIVPCSVIVSNWFVSRRGTALSVTFVGSNVGGWRQSQTGSFWTTAGEQRLSSVEYAPFWSGCPSYSSLFARVLPIWDWNHMGQQKRVEKGSNMFGA